MKKILLLLLLFLPQTGQAAFTDVQPDSFFAQRVQEFEQKSIVQGYADKTLRPDQPITRAEFIKLVTKNLSLPEIKTEQPCFTDVPINEWYANNICQAKAHGWIKGYPDGTFQPQHTVTLPEALKVLFQAHNLSYEPNLDPWYQDLVTKTQQLGLLPFSLKTFQQELNRKQGIDLVYWFDSPKKENPVFQRETTLTMPDIPFAYPHIIFSADYQEDLLYLFRISLDRRGENFPLIIQLGQNWQKTYFIGSSNPTFICLYIDAIGGEKLCESSIQRNFGDFEDAIYPLYLPGRDLQSFYAECELNITLKPENMSSETFNIPNKLLEKCPS